MTRGAACEDPLVWRGARPLARTMLLREAAAIAAGLPAGQHVVNLCEQREAFLLAFAACMMAGRVQLMPSARGESALAELRAEYPDSATITDEDVQRLRADAPQVGVVPALVPSDQDRLIMIGFTSGSTGKSQAHAKRWRALANSARLNSAAIRATLGLPAGAALSVLGTVPSHHMYGIELTVLLSLFAGMSVHADRPLFPADVAAALAQPARPRVLVSTPLHLRALAESGLAFPELDLIVSATAPLDSALARQIEERLRAPLLEMFGSTETCVFATRRTARQDVWKIYEGITLEAGADSTQVSAAWYERPQRLMDVLEMRGADGFVARGRNSDLVEVAGKRASLADITRRLCAVPGVADAVAFQPDGAAAGVANRVAAVVVSRGVSAKEIAAHLSASLDAVFLPRPLVLVEQIPRDAVGKVSRAKLLELTRSQSAD
ncbi:MAG TPA: class I adenylate-forming enzyme family protein [Steroidobacteraceae bacterium]|nr:class I adenylate-forming enzyme family protein [Steroidobacteraceae bacterium]